MPPARKKAAPAAVADEVPVESAAPRPSPGTSTDPAVHQLLAHRQSAELNGDDAAMAAVDAQLADLGY